ncbi:MAG: DsrE family protein [Bacillaceae bacterium]|nr:DsrE family protein [Bacillaceae bacterium]
MSPSHRTVVQINMADPKKWHVIMNNIKNLHRAFDGDIEIEVVAFGQGVGLLLKNVDYVEGMREELMQLGVGFSICRNTLNAKGMTPDDFLPGVSVVPSGVAEIVKKQEQGWTYLSL